MARVIHRLTPMAIAKKKKPGTYADGGGLCLQVTKSGSKSWSFRYMRGTRSKNGKPMSKEMGLGPLHTVSLAEARDKALEQRKLLLEGIDPIEHRRARRTETALQAKHAKTFNECAAAYIEAHRAGWKNAKHADQWENTLETYCGPVFGALPVQYVGTELIVQALSKIWTKKTETATRVRQRIEAVLDWATVSGYRKGDNPARWAGHLAHKLTDPSKLKHVENLPALPFVKVASFLVALRKQEGVAARAMEFMVLTAGRTGEIRGAVWDEIDLDERTWIIPAGRMKMKREHRVPLCDRAVAILEEMRKHRTITPPEEMRKHHAVEQPFVFPGGKAGKGLSDGALLALLRRMGRTGITPHGFRSTFRDWSSECTNYPHEVQEMALAHTIKNKAEAAYRRGDLFEKRRAMMVDWERYCATVTPGKITSIRSKAVA